MKLPRKKIITPTENEAPPIGGELDEVPPVGGDLDEVPTGEEIEGVALISFGGEYFGQIGHRVKLPTLVFLDLEEKGYVRRLEIGE